MLGYFQIHSITFLSLPLIFTKSLRNPYPTFTFLYYLYLFVNETHGSRLARYYCAHDAMTFMTLKL